MKDMHITSRKGMNTPNKVGRTLHAKDVGMITDGASLKQGYKKVSPDGRSPRAWSIQNKSFNKG